MENNIKEITVFDYESIKKLYKPHQLLDVRGELGTRDLQIRRFHKHPSW